MLNELTIPIVQGPMLGASTPALAVAVSNAGGLGSLAASGLDGAKLREAIAAMRAGTKKPFLVNLFAQNPAHPEPEDVKRAIERLAPWRARYGLAPQNAPAQWAQDFAAQFAVLVEEAPPAASFTFGCLTREQAQALRAKGTYLIGTATTVAEARAWLAVGADAICASGFESGGHRGSFLAPQEDSLIGTISLTRTIRAAVDVPVIAAGGITDGRAIAAALNLGANAVQIGTAYLLSDEASVSAPWQKALEEAGDDPTELTRVISGRYARGITNEFMRKLKPIEWEIPAYPVQNALTQELRAAAAKAGSPDVLSLWAGQSVKFIKRGKAADITHDLWREAQETLSATAQKWAQA
ncbi:NAD(P)H-dependent flavin oxidoreductase [Methylovirgula sp. 4M-Z18]|uniref:NAD(P)H-dependent flavin oxidoreductase n=1 Tax=Methylovirgula sp. 4M-Z18 TaxID=2293567 RepID=UPI000E2ECB42|nr:nitronate monooxygenase [Methylovirgula sp. 4M-Z18]RFB78144.1 nitronate monooxygenase [Methylovirgula sp. 4M-Z18]